jgi:catechol 2,3-dioxygenase-like lactoylglutathione lyase family enzyme
MRIIHIAIGVTDIAASVTDYTRRLDAAPVLVVPGEYALWRTETVNLSIRRVAAELSGQLRHLGWEDDACEVFVMENDVNGIAWERFTPEQQAAEIRAAWPDADYTP